MKKISLAVETLELFKNIIINNSLRSIRSIFQLNNEQGHYLDYKPPYQRKYVWTDVKATYLIETLLLHGEIPPIVIYVKGKTWEVIDGRQRCETIHRFIKDEFSLKPRGLDKLWNLAGKKCSQIEEKLRDRILDTPLRLIIITAAGDNVNSRTEELVKREIFKRYNSGISPLKKEEVFKAQYIQDDINIYFKDQFEKDVPLYHQIMDLFDHRRKNLETMMQHIRQVLVLHNIPINKFIYERDDIVNKYYDYLSYNMITKGVQENVALIFDDFKKKCAFLMEIKVQLSKHGVPSKGMIYESLFWALSVCEKEKVMSETLNTVAFKDKLVDHFVKQMQNYPIEQYNHSSKLMKRYELIAFFFASHTDIYFLPYLKSNEEFLVAHKERMDKYMAERFMPGSEEKHFSKTLPTSNSVSDIFDKMKRGKFNLKPAYQRTEVMDVAKASSLIESILLGLKIHPLYIYLTKDSISEVIDGQQRLLAIIGFLGEEYKNEHGNMVTSRKNNFSLNLQSGLLPHLHGKKFSQLSEEEQLAIKNYDLEIIEIREENNKHFIPEELFKRLNHKPIPIDEHTFEFWNAYVDSDIVHAIKGVCQRNSWLYLRIIDRRMVNEELVTCLSYIHYMTKGPANMKNIKEILFINRLSSTIAIRFKNRPCITHILESQTFKAEFLLAINDFELDFIEKAKLLIACSTGKKTAFLSNRQMDSILQTNCVRVPMRLYLLWIILKGIPIEYIEDSRSTVLQKISKIFSMLRTSHSEKAIEKAIMETWMLPIATGE